MERDPVQPPLLLFERKDCDTGGASVLITRQAVPLLLLGFWWCSSCCLPSVLQDLPWQCGTLEGKLISTWYNARVNGIDPVLYPHSGSHLQLSLHCNFLNPLLYSCFIGWSPYNLRLQPVALRFGENKMQFEYRCSFVVPPPPPHQFQMLSVCEVAVSLIFTTLLNFVSPVNVTGSDFPMLFFLNSFPDDYWKYWLMPCSVLILWNQQEHLHLILCWQGQLQISQELGLHHLTCFLLVSFVPFLDGIIWEKK